MRIGIDISQTAYENTGVGNYLKNLVEGLISLDRNNEYVFFFSSLRRKFPIKSQSSTFRQGFAGQANFRVKTFRYPPVFLDLLWNRLHIIPIEWFIGDVDVFITSDWTEPPSNKAKKITIMYDLIVKKYPKETDSKIVQTQSRRLKWVKKESDIIICISESTKNDVMRLLGISENRLKVVYPGI